MSNLEEQIQAVKEAIRTNFFRIDPEKVFLVQGCVAILKNFTESGIFLFDFGLYIDVFNNIEEASILASIFNKGIRIILGKKSMTDFMAREQLTLRCSQVGIHRKFNRTLLYIKGSRYGIR